ncbi:TPA: hypothetical protein HA273_00705 [Candidatus Bathyarchaeota archaeon]|nr:hypothetical protein [Candidatus Bathyarchaeota archaeon]
MIAVNRKFLLVVLALAAVLLATPFFGTVVAEPTKGQKVPATAIFIPLDSEDPEYWRTNGDIGQGRGGIETYRVFFNIGGTATSGLYTVVFDEMINFKTDMFVRRYTTLDSGLDNGFTGNILLKIYNYYSGVDVRYEVHCVLHGFGDFKGQELMLSYEGPTPLVWTGYCLKG